MSEAITRFFDRPALNTLHPPHDQHMAFLIEADHAAAAWGAFLHGVARYALHNDLRWLHRLVKHGIGIDRDLLQLSPLITDGDLSQRDDLLPLLTSRERPHRRVEQLLQGLQP
jgi:hypothetical protein